MDLSTSNNAWVDSYLDALMSFGLSFEHTGHLSSGACGASSRVPPTSSSTNSLAALDADGNVAQTYYVRQLLQQSEESIHEAWAKTRRMSNQRDARLQYISWRTWSMKRKQASVMAAMRGRQQQDDELDAFEDLDEAKAVGAEERQLLHKIETIQELKSTSMTAAASSMAETLAATMQTRAGAAPPSATIHLTASLGSPQDSGAPSGGACGAVDPLLLETFPRLYIILISLHGLVRGNQMELGKDADTGGQVKYVVELARSLGCIPSVARVDLLTRLIAAPEVDPSYSVKEEPLEKPSEADMADGVKPVTGSFIVRLPCGPSSVYLRKEDLWPHLREFGDRAIEHANATLARLHQETGEPAQLYLVHGHYADGGEAASYVSLTMGVPMALTGHSLGRNKREHLLKSGNMTGKEIEAVYRISRRVEAEERALGAATVVFTSTRQEVTEQWGMYDGYGEQMAAALRLRPCVGYHIPAMVVVPPGLDFSNLKVELDVDPWEAVLGPHALSTPGLSHSPSRRNRFSIGSTSLNADDTADLEMDMNNLLDDTAQKQVSGVSVLQNHSDDLNVAPPPDRSARGLASLMTMPGAQEPPLWREIFRFLRNPHKPAVLAMCRPDAKKNVVALIRAFGGSKVLRDLANLVLVLGNRDSLSAMAPGSQRVMDSVLRLIDEYDLYGQVAIPKRHTQSDISDIYLLSTATKGVFVNVALQEPFGLTLIEAAAHGAPIVATANGGPVDIIATLGNGLLVDPCDVEAITTAIISIITDTAKWEEYSTNGSRRITAYSWPGHCARYLRVVEDVVQKNNHNLPGGGGGGSGPLRHTLSFDAADMESFNLSLQDLDLPALVDGNEAAEPGPAKEGRQLMEELMNGSGGSGQPRAVAPPERPGSTPPMPNLTRHSLQAHLPREYDPLARLAQQAPTLGMVPQVPRMHMFRRFVVVSVDVREDLRLLPDILSIIGGGRDSCGKAWWGSGLVDALGTLLTEPAEEGAVGVGIMVPWSCRETKRLLKTCGLDVGRLAFLICDAGAMLWHVTDDWDEDGSGAGLTAEPGLQCDEDYERHVDYRWDPHVVKQVLGRISNSTVGWGKLKVLPSGGASTAKALPQSRFSSTGVSPGSFKSPPSNIGAGGGGGITLNLSEASSSPLRLTVEVGVHAGGLAAEALGFKPNLLISTIRRKLRRCGVVAQLLLTPGVPAAAEAVRNQAACRNPSSPVPQGAAAAAAPAVSAMLHVTPQRASRALALRFLAHRNRLPLDTFTVVAFSYPPSAVSSSAGSTSTSMAIPVRQMRLMLQQNKRTASVSSAADPGQAQGPAGQMLRPVYFASNDGEELLGGVPRAVVLEGPTQHVEGGSFVSAERMTVSFGVDAGVHEEESVCVVERSSMSAVGE